ncbi:unnamed protein product [Schistocephalus solidus]|uniref:Remorin_C domain-containing protein n=1 Tax=Schistocephalus solidus TaxID=70667 RepID=A0A183T8P7_SCHSO|nr:unnamed protein product [Schistocephalus solidus]
MAVIERYNWYTKQKFFIAWIEGVLMAKRERQLELEAEARRSAWSARLSKTQARHERAQVGSLSSQLALQAELMAKDMTEEALKRAAVEQEKRAMQTAKRAVKEEALERRRDALSTESTIVNTR